MTQGTVKTQGTHLFFVYTQGSSEPQIVKLACPTGITGMGGPKDQIESTCLDNTQDKEYEAGLGNPGQITVPFNLIPRDFSHQTLFDLKEAGDTLEWMACLSEGTDAPTLDSNAALEAPAGRSSLGFDAYIADVNIDIATNEIVRGTLILQRSGPVRPTWYTPA
jgi:hypothetical protein